MAPAAQNVTSFNGYVGVSATIRITPNCHSGTPSGYGVPELRGIRRAAGPHACPGNLEVCKFLPVWFAMADFERKSAIFHTLRPALEPAANTELKRISGEMADLIPNSAIPSEGSMRTSWPRLRNSYYANLALRSIPAKTTAGQQTHNNAPETL